MDNMNKRTIGLRRVGNSRFSNSEQRKVVVVSEPGAVLRVELIELSPAEERSLTTNVRIGGGQTNKK